MRQQASFVLASLVFFLCVTTNSWGAEPTDPETAIRMMIRANAEKDLPALSRLMAHDADIV
ncbi:MAG TPA: hypothetical protein DDY39_14095, partial [Nitrospira sp.]|nr:hypothetical protein [Nitrospira sp.]